MKIESTSVTKFLITDLMAEPYKLDPVTVFIEDLGVRAENEGRKTRQGKITIECYGESWSTYWGSMGDRTVAQFVADESVDYVVGCLRRGVGLEPTVFSGEALAKAVRNIAIGCRRGRETWRYECGRLDQDEARRIYDDAECLQQFESPESLMHSREADEVLTALFGSEWHYAVSDHAFAPNPRYEYLTRVVSAVRNAMQSLEQQQEAA